MSLALAGAIAYQWLAVAGVGPRGPTGVTGPQKGYTAPITGTARTAVETWAMPMRTWYDSMVLSPRCGGYRSSGSRYAQQGHSTGGDGPLSGVA